MEQTLIDFFAQSSELILHNRLPNGQLPSTIPLADTFSSRHTRFQLSFDRKVEFTRQLTPEWNSQAQKLLVIEFFVHSKTTGERHLAEQWIFQITPISYENLNDTIDSSNTLYKKLSILLRTISALTVTLPLYQKVIEERGSSCLSQSLIIDYSISHSQDTMSSWHPTVYGSKDLAVYKSSDFVLPGRAFSFKVNYSKSLRFLQEDPEDDFEHVEAEEPAVQCLTASLVRRAFSDNTYNKDTRALDFVFLDDSPAKVTPFEDDDNKYFSSQIEAIQLRKRMKSELVCRKETAPRVWDMSKVIDASKLKMKTVESESFGEGDIFLCENDEERFTEVLTWQDLSMQAQSPARIDGSSGFPLLKMLSEDSEKTKMKISVNTKSIEKLMEHTQDDNFAELLNSIQDLKNIAAKRESERSEDEKVKSQESKDEVCGKGLRFEGDFKCEKGLNQEILDPLNDIKEFKQLYLQVRRSGSTK